MKKYLFLFLMAMPLFFMGCSSDDDDETTPSKSELIGTWYTLEDGWVLVFKESTVTEYEIWKNSGKYSLNSYTLTSSYSIKGNKIVSEDGWNATVSINGNKLKLTEDEKTLTYTKFNGTPQQLIDYLNK